VRQEEKTPLVPRHFRFNHLHVMFNLLIRKSPGAKDVENQASISRCPPCARTSCSDMSTTTITPRWEWRCFSPSLMNLAHRVSIPSDAAPRESKETYILDLTGRISENVKIRDALLDVKRLLQTDFDGLELWVPVLKTQFPLDRKDVAAVFGPWMPPVAAVIRESYTFTQLIEDIVAPQPALRVVEVRKSRRAFTFAGCLAEFVKIRAESVSIQSFALEHEDPQRLLAALRTLGLDPRANINYMLGLKRALGLEHAAA